MNAELLSATEEIHKSLSYCNFATTKLGISYINDLPSTFRAKLKSNIITLVSAAALFGIVIFEISYVTSLLIGSTNVAEFVASLHIVGYGSMSLSKLVTVWMNRHLFRLLVKDLAKIWPVQVNEEEAKIKQERLKDLRFVQFWYMFFNILGVVLYNLTPLGLYLYKLSRGIPANIGYIWHAKYPFDKTKPIYHEFAYVFEAFSGTVSVWSMLSGDLMFSTMASHLSMLLRILQVKIRNFASEVKNQPNGAVLSDGFDNILFIIKTHQRLINYTQDLEDVFSMVNLINVVLSSINICCVVFNIVLLEPWMDMSNKFFLGAVLTQMGMLCWYADDIYRTSIGVSDAAYDSGWYKSSIRCRKALLLLLARSQKPLCFTALKFRSITMTTYSSILTTSYSYFTLLYTMYRG